MGSKETERNHRICSISTPHAHTPCLLLGPYSSRWSSLYPVCLKKETMFNKTVRGGGNENKQKQTRVSFPYSAVPSSIIPSIVYGLVPQGLCPRSLVAWPKENELTVSFRFVAVHFPPPPCPSRPSHPRPSHLQHCIGASPAPPLWTALPSSTATSVVSMNEKLKRLGEVVGAK